MTNSQEVSPTNTINRLQINMSRKIIATTQVQKFCKVCQDAGKSEAEYRSHFTRENRDPNSRVVCPTLLALECRFCFKKGHTVKYCKILKEKDSSQETRSVQTPKKPEDKTKGKKITNQFDCLGSDSEDEEEMCVKKPEVTEDFPALAPPPVLKRSDPVTINYAAALSKPVTKPIVPIISAEAPVQKPAPWASSEAQKPFKMRSWADDWSDSDTEDEEEDKIDWQQVVKNDDWY